MSFVLNLPEVTVTQVLVEWLTLKSVARLDSAFCTQSSRDAFLDYAYHHIPVTYPGCDVHYRWEQFVNWCALRSVPIDGLTVNAFFADERCLHDKIFTSLCSRWKWVNLSGINGDPQRYLIDVARWCPKIRAMNLWLPDNIENDDCLAHLTAACKQLETLDLVMNVSTESFARALKHCEVLRHLRVSSRCDIPPEVAISSLESLVVADGTVSDAVLVAIGKKCPNLQTMEVFRSNSANLTDAGVRTVLQGCSLLSQTDYQYASSVSNATRVALFRRDMHCTEFNMDRWLGLTAVLAQDLLRVWPHLRTICSSKLQANPALNDATLAACAAPCPLLETLNIHHNSHITTQGALPLFRPCSQLRCIDIQHCSHLTVEVILAIAAHCRCLQECDLSFMDLTDASIVQLAEGCPQLESVTLDGTDVGDAGVTALAQRCLQLTTLSVAHDATKLTTASLHAIADHCPRLHWLVLPQDLLTSADRAVWSGRWRRKKIAVLYEP